MKAIDIDYDGIELTVLRQPEKRKLHSWALGTYDAVFYYRGIRFLRYQGGFGKRGDRTDWVADLPIAIHVAHFQGRVAELRRVVGPDGSDGWGIRCDQTLRVFLDGEIKAAEERVRGEIGGAHRRVSELEAALATLTTGDAS